MTNAGIGGWLLLAWSILVSFIFLARIVRQDDGPVPILIHAMTIAVSWTVWLWMVTT